VGEVNFDIRLKDGEYRGKSLLITFIFGQMMFVYKNFPSLPP